MKLQEFMITNVVEVSPDQSIGVAVSARFAMVAEPRSADSDNEAKAANAIGTGDPEGGQRT